MNLTTLIYQLNSQYEGLNTIDTWGEMSLFYNPQGFLKRGAYFLTFKQKDGEHDAASMLNREAVQFRMNFKVNRSTFLCIFDEPKLPARPSKGGVTVLASDKQYDPTIIDTLFPHPVYAWMSWVSIINPSAASIDAFNDAGLLDEAYQDAVQRYQKASTRKQSMS
ncbi:MAG: DUF6194 family protein [Legionellaceae bacterium]|nr:DUF6194 family protein [Legionellaceae bacterium]